MHISLAGKVALVTGGSRGIGRAICVELSALGAKVFVNYAQSKSAADETVGLCAAGSEAEAIGFDVASSEAVEAAFETIKGKAGRVDILVNNAGIAIDGLTMRYKDEDWRKIMAINLDGAFYCARAAMRGMMKNRWGRIINISSVVGEMGNAGQVAYVSSKSAIIGMTKALAKELASRLITVNAVTPGFIATDMTSHMTEEQQSGLMQSIPLGRVGQPQEVANVVAFLASEAAGYMTGQVVGVNGGLYM